MLAAMSAKLCSKGFHDECPVPDANSANSSESNIIRRFMGKNQVVFKDGSRHNISLVIYATGDCEFTNIKIGNIFPSISFLASGKLQNN